MSTEELKQDTIRIVKELKEKLRKEIDKTEKAINN